MTQWLEYRVKPDALLTADKYRSARLKHEIAAHARKALHLRGRYVMEVREDISPFHLDRIRAVYVRGLYPI